MKNSVFSSFVDIPAENQPISINFSQKLRSRNDFFLQNRQKKFAIFFLLNFGGSLVPEKTEITKICSGQFEAT